jgi:hypothetical protein
MVGATIDGGLDMGGLSIGTIVTFLDADWADGAETGRMTALRRVFNRAFFLNATLAGMSVASRAAFPKEKRFRAWRHESRLRDETIRAVSAKSAQSAFQNS